MSLCVYFYSVIKPVIKKDEETVNASCSVSQELPKSVISTPKIKTPKIGSMFMYFKIISD